VPRLPGPADLRRLRPRNGTPTRLGRLVFLALGLLTLATVPVALAVGEHASPVGTPVALGALGVLAASWALADRRGAMPWAHDPAEFAAVALVGVAIGSERATGVFFAGLFLRALLVSAPRLALSAGGYVAAWVLVGAVDGGAAGALGALPRAGVMPLTAAGMFLFGRTLARYEGAQARERELVEEIERRRGEERFRTLVHASSDLILVVDAAGVVTFASPSAERALGVGRDGLLGRALAEVSAAPLPPLAPGPLEWRARAADGASVELEAIVADLRADVAVGGFVLTSRDVRERRAFERRLAHQAFHDALTGLPNRLMLLDRLAERVAAPGGQPPTVLLLDLEEFTMVNDSLGHAAGDELLLGVASRLRALVRTSDVIARLGSDEFVLLVDGGSDETAAAVAARTIEVLGRPFVLQGKEVRTGVSVGIASGTGDPAELLRNADAALQAAKERGGPGFAFFEPAMQAAALTRLALRADLERALERGELVLHFQPTVDVETGRVGGVEALVRWAHPERGLVAPGTFVPLAEETGLIVPLGRWVLAEACRQVRAWHDLMPWRAPLRVSVNVSGRQLLDPALVDDVAAALDASGLDPHTLVLEITETVLAQNTEVAVERLRALRELGVRTAIDDFGTGYSSLRYLQQFPLDVLKIDRSFVEDVDRGDHGSTFAQVIVDLARALGLETVAEGIERPSQLAVLRSLGCTTGQGFHFARPVPPAALTALLEREALDGTPLGTPALEASDA
jgi:diguanylate cyclase (GGDEF)-like protein